jgi:OmpA-OmpF porin, OOP family
MRTALLLAALASIFTLPVLAAPNAHDTVSDNNNNIAVNTFNNCVRTKWDSPSDPCAPAPKVVAAPAPAPAPVVSPARQLSKEALTVYFDFDKSSILASEAAKLDNLANVLKTDQAVKSVRIVGYADRMGNAGYNERLSQLRAHKVEEYMRGRGYLRISGAQTRWLGDTAPRTQCADSLKRADKIVCLREDRRVEVEIDYVK